jgi:predicted RNA-binding Zn ribbon-like protein
MPISANARSAAAPAPEGLDLVQELLNTASSGLRAPSADLLSDARTAADWLAALPALRALPRVAIDDAGVARLRALRDDIRATIRRRDGRPEGPTDTAAASVPVALAMDVDGAVRVVPADGVEPVSGLVLGEILLAQERGDWARLKLCALAPCSVAFYDRTRNLAGRFHTARCANHVNLRASRERHRADRA